MAYSIREAAELAEVSKSTIQRLLKKPGGLSKNADGKIEGSELARLYPNVVQKLGDPEKVNTPEHSQSVPVGHREHSQMNTPEHSVGHQLAIENAGLKAELEVTKQLAQDRQAAIEDLRTRLDTSEQERRAAQEKVTALLTDQRERPEPAPPLPRTRPVFWWLLGGAAAAIAVLLWMLANRPEVLAAIGA